MAPFPPTADSNPAAKAVGTSIEDRQVERFAWAKPDDVIDVIGAVVAGRGVGENGQAGALTDSQVATAPKRSVGTVIWLDPRGCGPTGR